VPQNCGQTMNMWTVPETYEGYIGRWSRITAPVFLAWLEVRPQARWLDVGCGTGGTTSAILDGCDAAAVDGFDLSDAYIAFVRKHITDPRATFSIADAQALPCADASYDAAVAGLCLNAMPDQPRALAEMARPVKPGGVVAAYMWDFDGEMQMLKRFWDAVAVLDPSNEELADDPQFAICRPEPLAALFRGAGLHDVEVRAIDTPTVFKDFDDFWTPFTHGQAPAQKHTAALSEERRIALRDHLRTSLPIAADGSISLIARAWAAKGIVPL
jgi:SAM-dependent methyltransferase